ncbi:hypothetical protein IKG05_01615 [Candidatus Saccharibacteria bacterium]|nr:hypothetical protein [Candidatus Saccharibacteria bacterium]
MKKRTRLGGLKAARLEARKRKDAAYFAFNEASKRAGQAYREMREARRVLRQAKKKMNREFMIQKGVSDQRALAWAEFDELKERNNTQIKALRRKSDKEYRIIKKLHSRIGKAYKCGRQLEAVELSLKKEEHQIERSKLNAQIGILIDEIQEAMQQALSMPEADFTLFEEARRGYKQALKNCRELNDSYQLSKQEKIRSEKEFCQRREELKEAEEALLKEQERIRTDSLDKCNQILNWTGMGDDLKEDAKIVVKDDGTTHIYYGGIGGGDGFGHGHIVLNELGQVIYKRGIFESHGSHNHKVPPTT